jgi:uncharacterized protein (TIGR03437 family)
MRKALLLWFLFVILGPGQNVGYVASLVSGADRINDGHSALGTLLRQPLGVAIDSAGNLYVSDGLDNRIRKVTAGTINTLAGTGLPSYGGDGGPANEAFLNSPGGIAMDAAGNLFVADRGNNVIRMITPTGTISTVAGNGFSTYNGENVTALAAQFQPETVAVDAAGNLYISDTAGFRVRKVDKTGNVTTIAGSGINGYAGDGKPAIQAQISQVFGIAVDAAGNIYLADSDNYVVRVVDPSGKISSFAGTGSFFDFPGATQALSTPLLPFGIGIAPNGDVYVTDALSNQIVAINPKSGNIRTVVGNGTAGFSGDQGVATAAELDLPVSPVLDAKGNLFFADEQNHRVREVSAQIISTVVGTGPGDNAPAVTAFLSLPSDTFADGTGKLWIADNANGELREINPSTGIISSFGTFGPITANGRPGSLAEDSDGNIYVGTNAYLIAKVTPNGQTFAIAGTGTPGAAGDGGRASAAEINDPEGLAVDGKNSLYIADWGAEVVRKIDAAGTITKVAGTGQLLASGDGGPALSAGIDPTDIALDALGNLYISDTRNNRIRKIGLDGKISTVVGNGLPGKGGDGGPAASASLNLPSSVALDAHGNLFICDEGNARIRRVDAVSGLISTIAGSGTAFPAKGSSGPARTLNIDTRRLRVASNGDLIVTDQLNDRVYRLTAVTVTPAQFAVVTGDKQTGGTSTTLSTPLTVQVTGSDGFGYAGSPVTFQVTSGAATVSPATTVTDANGNASASVTLGAQPGTVTVEATAQGLNVLTFTETANSLPTISDGGIVGAASSTPPVTTLSAGAIISIFGTLLAAPGTHHQVSGGDLVKGNLPTQLEGVCVLIGGAFAPLFYVSDTQLNVQVPALAPLSAPPVQVITDCGQPDQVLSTPVNLTWGLASPEFFYALHATSGKNYVAATNDTTGALVGPPGLISGGNFAPAKAGDILTIYGTGFGATNPASTPGVPAPAAASVKGQVSVQIGSVTLSAGDILYTGVTPTYAGLYQLNIRVPAGLSAGDQPVGITIGGVTSPSNAVLTIAK